MEYKLTGETPETLDTPEVIDELRRRIATLEAANRLLALEAAEWRQKAETDSTTGLFNREGLSSAIETLNLAEVSVIYIDLDNFKKVNDLFGHKRGDAALIHIAELLNKSTRDEDVVARVGGDEFVVIAPHIIKDQSVPKSADEQRLAVCNRIKSAMEELLDSETDLRSVEFGISVGSILGREGVSAEDLIQEADQLMYKEKNQKR